jgi:prepilin-type N-terminal cleavage/methylation domain-containing protein
MIMKRRTTARGYTAIEVLMAMSVFAIGAAAIIGMMRASIQGNLDARRLDQANSLAREWMERLRRDAMKWTTATNLNQTTFINLYKDTGKWEMPTTVCPASSTPPPPDGLCPAFDTFGRDLATDHYQDAAFCVHIRIDTAAMDFTNTNPTVLRTMVRVVWPRGLTVPPFVSGSNRFCSTAALTDSTAGPDPAVNANALQIYHYVQAVSLLSNTPIPQ